MMLGVAYAVQTVLTATALKENNYAVVAGDLALPSTACDNVNGNAFAATGREILLVNNPDAAPHTFTVTSLADPFGRFDTSLTGYSVPATSLAVIYLNTLTGWRQANGQILLACNSNLLKFSIIQVQH
jgi:hypothetical protein